MSVVLNEAAITRFFGVGGGPVEVLLVRETEKVLPKMVEEADAVVQHRFHTDEVMDFEILEGPLRASVGIFDRMPRGDRIRALLNRKAREEDGWVVRALNKARGV